jgi:hypothetical protein
MLLLPKTERHRSPRHLVWIRMLPCSVPGCSNDEIHAHHVRKGAGVAIKPADGNAVPLCAEHHAEGHSGGWRTFEIKYGIDLAAIARELWERNSMHETSPSQWSKPTMSATSDIIPAQHVSAVAVLRERERVLDAEIEGYQRQMDIANARRDELLDLIATLTRKPRVRKPRAVAEATPEATTDPRPSALTAPANDGEAQTDAA